jgi:UDP-glucose 4-epimerase
LSYHCLASGYIGSHTIVSLLEAGFDVTVIDNLVNSSEKSLERVQEITNCDPSRIRFFKADLRDQDAIETIFQMSPTFAACIHFAGLKVTIPSLPHPCYLNHHIFVPFHFISDNLRNQAVGESMHKPLLYYENNIGGTLVLLNLLDRFNCHRFVFSSSATVYGLAEVLYPLSSPPLPPPSFSLFSERDPALTPSRLQLLNLLLSVKESRMLMEELNL